MPQSCIPEVKAEDAQNYTCSKCKWVCLLEGMVQESELALSMLQLIRAEQEGMNRAQETLLEGQQDGTISNRAHPK